MDVSAFSIAAIHRTHLLVGASPDIRAIIRVSASGLGEEGVDASLRLWTPRGASVVVLRERSPSIRDLRGRAIRLDDRTVEYAAGRWTDGGREYELVIALPPGRAGDDMLATRVGVVAGGVIAGRAPIALTWTDDEAVVAAGSSPARSTCTEAEQSSTADPGRCEARAVADLPTGPSPAPRHTVVLDSCATTSCPACDLPAGEDDRFCERCGCELAGDQKS
jgi:hypothetical protein